MIRLLTILLLYVNAAAATTVYNYYELAVQKWCSDEYMIHGLWPQINATDYPEYCESVSYEMPTGELLTNMNTYWKSCDDTLWQHEWEKHGSCMHEQIGIDETTFFNTTITLFLKNTNLLNDCKEDDCILACFDMDYKKITCK